MANKNLTADLVLNHFRNLNSDERQIFIQLLSKEISNEESELIKQVPSELRTESSQISNDKRSEVISLQTNQVVFAEPQLQLTESSAEGLKDSNETSNAPDKTCDSKNKQTNEILVTVPDGSQPSMLQIYVDERNSFPASLVVSGVDNFSPKRKTHAGRGGNKTKIRKESINYSLLERVKEAKKRQEQMKKKKPQKDESEPLQITPPTGEHQYTLLTLPAIEEISNKNQAVTENSSTPTTTITKLKKTFVSEEFKQSHLSRLEEAKKRREEMNRRLEQEGKRRPRKKSKPSETDSKFTQQEGKSNLKKSNSKKATESSKKVIDTVPHVIATEVVETSRESDEVLQATQQLNREIYPTIQIIGTSGQQTLICRTTDGTNYTPINWTGGQWQSDTNQSSQWQT